MFKIHWKNVLFRAARRWNHCFRNIFLTITCASKFTTTNLTIWALMVFQQWEQLYYRKTHRTRATARGEGPGGPTIIYIYIYIYIIYIITFNNRRGAGADPYQQGGALQLIANSKFSIWEFLLAHPLGCFPYPSFPALCHDDTTFHEGTECDEQHATSVTDMRFI